MVYDVTHRVRVTGLRGHELCGASASWAPLPAVAVPPRWAASHRRMPATCCRALPAPRTTQESYDHVREWLKEVDRYASPDTCKLLIGNKSDRSDKVVSEGEGSALGKELNMPFLETSARTAENVEAAFIRMAEQLIKMRCVVQGRRCLWLVGECTAVRAWVRAAHRTSRPVCSLACEPRPRPSSRLDRAPVTAQRARCGIARSLARSLTPAPFRRLHCAPRSAAAKEEENRPAVDLKNKPAGPKGGCC